MWGIQPSARAISIIAMITLAGCTTLPNSGPSHQSIERGAIQQIGYAGKKPGINYLLVDINSNTVRYLPVSSTGSLRNWGTGEKARPQIRLGVGDVVQVTIFEARSGGLFVPDEAGSRPGNFVTLPAQAIDQSGLITVPYAGKIKAAGRTSSQVQSEIERVLHDRAIEPQVVVSTIEARANQISVLGDVKLPARVDVNPAGERILDVISRAGGIVTPSRETTVTLQRRGQQASVLFDELVSNPAENIYVAPGDTIYASRERRTYVAFGASGQNGRFDFEETNLTLSEALGKAGGLLDERADPAQVFLYRLVDSKTARRLGADIDASRGGLVPVVFHANLREPAAFFAIQKFAMQDKDILYVSNSDSIQLLKFLGIVSAVTRTPSDVSGAYNVLR